MRRVRARIFQAYVLVSLLAFAGLTLLANTAPVFGPDVEITRQLQENLPGWAIGLMQAVSWPGYGLQSVVLAALLTVAFFVSGLRWEASAAAFAAASSAAMNALVKEAVSRPRPDASLVNVITELSTYSFPSGHVMFYVTFFGFLLFLSLRLLKRPWQRALVSAILILLIALVGLSRMVLGEHWATDVLGGYLLGSLMLALSIRFYGWGKGRFFVQPPGAQR